MEKWLILGLRQEVHHSRLISRLNIIPINIKQSFIYLLEVLQPDSKIHVVKLVPRIGKATFQRNTKLEGSTTLFPDLLQDSI